MKRNLTNLTKRKDALCSVPNTFSFNTLNMGF